MKKLAKLIKGHRFWFMGVGALAVVGWFWHDDPNGGLQLKLQMQGLVGLLVALPLVYIFRRVFIEARSEDAVKKAMEHPIGAGLVVLGLCILVGLLFIATSGRALSAPIPPGAVQYMPTLLAEISAKWPGMPLPAVLASQIEQESGWKVGATLKTSRELGAGFGQFTKAYRADGSVRFDALGETKRLDKSLAGWNWANAYNPTYQLRAVVLKNRQTFGRIRRLVDDDYNAMAMMDGAYNCGEGCVYARRRLCAQIKDCDPDVWFGNVERHSSQSKTKWQGYGQSAHDITNTHVKNVMVVRLPKYVAWLGGNPA